MKEANLKRLHYILFQLYDFLLNIKTRDSKKISDCQSVGRGEGRKSEAQIFKAVKLFCSFTKVGIWHDKFVQIYKLYAWRANPNVNCGFCVILMWQCRLFICNKCSTVLWMLIMGEVVCVCGGKDIWVLYILSTSFSCEPKTILRKKVYLNGKKGHTILYFSGSLSDREQIAYSVKCSGKYQF